MTLLAAAATAELLIILLFVQYTMNPQCDHIIEAEMKNQTQLRSELHTMPCNKGGCCHHQTFTASSLFERCWNSRLKLVAVSVLSIFHLGDQVRKVEGAHDDCFPISHDQQRTVVGVADP